MKNKPYTIGVFDSGVGGKSVANAIKKGLPDSTVLYREDKENVPYGTKSKDELFALVHPILEDMSTQCDIIVIACNTVSTVLITELRAIISVPLVAIEPMIKPAALKTKSRVIAVFATPTTLSSTRYAWLKDQYAKNLTVLEPDCSDWSAMIENNEINEAKIEDTVENVCSKGADVIVLGCTHYHWIEEEIKAIARGRAQILQPESAIVSRVEQVLVPLA